MIVNMRMCYAPNGHSDAYIQLQAASYKLQAIQIQPKAESQKQIQIRLHAASSTPSRQRITGKIEQRT